MRWGKGGEEALLYVLMVRFLVTSALPYANGPIHFGHIAGAYLPADTAVRFLRMQGHEVLYVCGTDEHGVAITLRAEEEGISYQESVDLWHGKIHSLFDRFQIHFDIFSGTARCPQHAETCRKFFEILLENGWIESREEEQWYSEKAERFLPDRYLQGTCPQCQHDQARGDECPACGTWVDARQLGNPVSLVDGSRPVLRNTRHWYLDLPGLLKAGLGEWYEGQDSNHPHRPWKPNVDGQVRALLKDLQQRPITRDLPWGIPVPEHLPGAEGKVLYVWFDAPIGYLSMTMEWANKQGKPEAWKDFWLDPATRLMHFIGKDNIAFHCVVFPAMLLGQGTAWEDQPFILPWAVPANEFYNLEGRKFSTSEGWYVDNDRFFERYSADAIRFHLLLTSPETSDSEFTWEGFQTTNNALLADKLGNLASRVLKFVDKRYENRVPAPGNEANPNLKEADAAWAKVGTSLENQEFARACRALLAGCDALNRYFDAQAPWKSIHSEDPAERVQASTTIERCLAYLELCSRRLLPFCPNAAAQLRTMLGDAATHLDGNTWGEEGIGNPPAPLPEGQSLGQAIVLFPKILQETLAEELDFLQDSTANKTTKT